MLRAPRPRLERAGRHDSTYSPGAMSGSMPIKDDEATGPSCPSCGYARVGIAADARCPECGAEGFDGVLVVHGTTRFSGAGALVAVGVLAAYGALLAASVVRAVSRGSATPAGWSPMGSLGELLLLAVDVGVIAAILFVRRRRWREFLRGGAARPGSVVWNVHPRGIEVREGQRRTWIPRERIGRIDCVDALVGPRSQLVLILRRATLQGAFGTTRIVYLRGSKDERRAVWRQVRQTVGLA